MIVLLCRRTLQPFIGDLFLHDTRLHEKLQWTRRFFYHEAGVDDIVQPDDAQVGYVLRVIVVLSGLLEFPPVVIQVPVLYKRGAF